MRELFFFLLLVVYLAGKTYGQVDSTLQKQQDSLIVLNAYKYDLKYGISMFHRFCYNQKTYSKNAVLLREINYIPQTADQKVGMSSIIYYYYNAAGLLQSQEVFKSDGTIDFAVKHIYNSDKQVTSKTIYTLSEGELKVLGDTLYKYKGNKLYQVIARNNKKKKLAITIITEEQGRTMQTCIIKNPNLLINQPVKMETSSEVSNGQISTKRVINYYKDGQTDTTEIKMKYTAEGLLAEKSVYINSRFLKTMKFEYYPDGFLKSLSVNDEKGQKIEFTSVDINRIIHNYGGFNSIFIPAK